MKKNKEKLKNIFFYLIILILVGIFLINSIKEYNIKKQIEEEEKSYTRELKENKEYLESIIEQAKDIDKSEIYAYNKPYILEGFKHITGEYNTGFVIQDELQNEFVWIPCSLDEESNITILNRYDFNENSDNFMYTKSAACMEKSQDIQEFIQSIQKYGGFYIARFEAGKENEILVSKPSVQAWNNLTQQEAIELSKNMYSSKEFNSSLVNSFAWDTTLKWIEESNNIKFSEIKINSNNNSYITGSTSINNIYDLNDNVSEWSTETLEKFAIYRAGEFYGDNSNESSAFVGNRNVISKNAKYDIIGFRVILYKN